MEKKELNKVIPTAKLSTQTSALALEIRAFLEAVYFILQLPEEEKQGGQDLQERHKAVPGDAQYFLQR